MKLCVVGNGPSAEGHGAEIDACDFVVRIKAWWRYGAEGSGNRTDAVAWFGTQEQIWQEGPLLSCEHWRTWSDEGYVNGRGGWAERKAFFEEWAKGRVIRRLPHSLWERLHVHLNRDPSTGTVAVAMAMHFLTPANLFLTGFDATTCDRPNYLDARNPNPGRNAPHDLLAEKRAIAELLEGRWLGKPSQTKLTWPDMPDLT